MHCPILETAVQVVGVIMVPSTRPHRHWSRVAVREESVEVTLFLSSCITAENIMKNVPLDYCVALHACQLGTPVHTSCQHHPISPWAEHHVPHVTGVHPNIL